MELGIVDYGMGNHASLANILRRCGVVPNFIQRPAEIQNAKRIILPGVGAFGAAMNRLGELDLIQPLKDYAKSGKPMLGICLGMQIMFEGGEEGGDALGLGLFKGRVVRMIAQGIKVPHVGFNDLAIRIGSGIFKGMIPKPDFYFTHGYWVTETSSTSIAAVCNHGMEFVAAVERGRIAATQFHPELSQANGVKLMENFLGRVDA